MNVLVLYQDDSKEADKASVLLRDAGHTARCHSVATALDGTAWGDTTDVMIVFAEIHKEKETYAACERLRASDGLRNMPLLVAVNMYQMPLANRVKGMPNAHFIFTPIREGDLQDRFRMLAVTSKEECGQP